MYGVIAFLPLFLQTVDGKTASDSGLLLMPLMLGLIGASVVAGQVVTRTGRYRAFPIIGTSLMTLGIFLLSRLGPSSPSAESSGLMCLTGIGLGLTMQIIVLAVQNEVPAPDLGIATSAVNFFRSIGGSAGVALIGALFTRRLAHALGTHAPPTPSEIAAIHGPERVGFVATFAHALARTFVYVVPLGILAIALSAALRETPLRQHVHLRIHADGVTEAL
jgi:MFS family permease